MTIIEDAESFAEDAIDAFAELHSATICRVRGGVVRRAGVAAGNVAVLTGGGSGHYPAFAGLVGSGLASGAICGNVFTSPSARQAIAVAREAENGGGVLFVFGNYAGDVLHFGAAQEQLRADAIDCRTVLVTDDIASAPPAQRELRRGIAGLVPVLKIAAAAAEGGCDLDTVEAIAGHANARTRTLGVALDGCTLPGADEPLFTIDPAMMYVGLGIHGEPGIEDRPRADVAGLARLLVGRLLDECPDDAATQRAAVVVNGLGRVPIEELYVLYHHISTCLHDAGLGMVGAQCGNYVTSLDMAGVSLTLCWLDDELETWWRRPAETPAIRFAPATASDTTASQRRPATGASDRVDAVEPDALVAAAPRLLEFIDAALRAVSAAEHELGRIDAVAGDGDHGRGMVRGLSAARDAAQAAVDAGGGVATALRAAGEAWSDRAGGTSGALWGAALTSAATVTSSVVALDPTVVESAVRAAVDVIERLGQAKAGDKTMLDALIPLANTLTAKLTTGTPIEQAWRAAATAAEEGAKQTAVLTPRVGRARPLADKSIGTVDAGASSAALIAQAITAELPEPRKDT